MCNAYVFTAIIRRQSGRIIYCGFDIYTVYREGQLARCHTKMIICISHIFVFTATLGRGLFLLTMTHELGSI